jgi:hypothetical protein
MEEILKMAAVEHLKDILIEINRMRNEASKHKIKGKDAKLMKERALELRVATEYMRRQVQNEVDHLKQKLMELQDCLKGADYKMRVAPKDCEVLVKYICDVWTEQMVLMDKLQKLRHYWQTLEVKLMKELVQLRGNLDTVRDERDNLRLALGVACGKDVVDYANLERLVLSKIARWDNFNCPTVDNECRSQDRNVTADSQNTDNSLSRIMVENLPVNFCRTSISTNENSFTSVSHIDQIEAVSEVKLIVVKDKLTDARQLNDTATNTTNIIPTSEKKTGDNHILGQIDRKLEKKNDVNIIFDEEEAEFDGLSKLMNQSVEERDKSEDVRQENYPVSEQLLGRLERENREKDELRVALEHALEDKKCLKLNLDLAIHDRDDFECREREAHRRVRIIG